MKTPERQPKPLAAFDLDGTTYKSSILESLVEALYQAGEYSQTTYSEITELRSKWETNNSEAQYLAYIGTMVGSFLKSLSGKKIDLLSNSAQELLDTQKLRRRRFACEAMHLLSISHTVVAISGSPQPAVDVFAHSLGIDHSFGSRLDSENEAFSGTGRTIDKVAVIRKLVGDGAVLLGGSIAFGDTFNDAPMLGEVTHAVCINPSATLELEARNRGWHVVRESKDNISHITPDGIYHGIQTTSDILERIIA